MSSMQEDIQCAGSDTRPPMLDRTDFESWQQRIRLYCLGKDNGENIMKSIKEGPFQMGTVSDVITGGTEGEVQQGPVRARVLKDLSAEEKERYKADIRATNILLQGIPKDIYSLINHYTDAKDIWENDRESCGFKCSDGKNNRIIKGRPFQRNNVQEEMVVAWMYGATETDRRAIIESWSSETHQVLQTTKVLGHIAIECIPRPNDFKIQTTSQAQDATNASQESGAVLGEEQPLFLCREYSYQRR
ncbi:hypothetical protein Tco_1539037 [Tanacetum coccineum]